MRDDGRSPLYPDSVLGRHGDPQRVRPARTTAGMVIDSWRRRPVPRRILSALSVLLLLGGIAMFSFPFLTNVYSDYQQTQLHETFGTVAHKEAYRTRTIQPGDALTKIVIPRLGVETVVVEGTSLSALRAGAGHYQDTALPCERGNAAIAGHRTTYGKPFANIDDLRPGDRITLITPVGRCTYRVSEEPWVTHPADFEVLDRMKGSFLTLTTCHPPGSADERLIVRASLVRSRVGA